MNKKMENVRRVDLQAYAQQRDTSAPTDISVAGSTYYSPLDDGQEGTIVAFDAETAARRRHQRSSNREVQARRTFAPLVTAGTIVEIYNAGNSLGDTADQLGVTRGDVRRALAQEDVSVRDRKTAARVSWRDEVKEARVAKVHTPESDALRKEKNASRLQDPQRRAELRRYYHEKFLKNVAEVFGQDPKSRIKELLANGEPVDVAVQLGIAFSFLTRAQKHFEVEVEIARSKPGAQIPLENLQKYEEAKASGHLDRLTKRQKEVMRLRYEERETQQEVADRSGVNRQSVQQVEKGGFKRLEPLLAEW